MRAIILTTLFSLVIIGCKEKDDSPDIQSSDSTLADASNDIEDQYNEAISSYKSGLYEENLDVIQEAAKKGYPRAQIILAYDYLQKLDQNTTHWEKALTLYDTYLKEQKGKKDSYFKKVSFLIGNNYETAQYVPRNKKKAIYYYKIAVKYGDSDAQFFYGKHCYLGDWFDMDLSKAQDLLKKSSESGHVEASFLLGEIYELCDEFQNLEKAAELYTKAASNGYVLAYYPLGRLYQLGMGVEVDPDLAKKYYELGAIEKDSNCLLSLGLSYKYGIVTPKDFEKSFEYIKESASYNNTDAIYELGLSYMDGIGVIQDKDIALQNFRKSSKLGNIKARNFVKKLEEEQKKADELEKNRNEEIQRLEKKIEISKENLQRSQKAAALKSEKEKELQAIRAREEALKKEQNAINLARRKEMIEFNKKKEFYEKEKKKQILLLRQQKYKVYPKSERYKELERQISDLERSTIIEYINFREQNRLKYMGEQTEDMKYNQLKRAIDDIERSRRLLELDIQRLKNR